MKTKYDRAQMEDRDPLGASLERMRRYEAELETCAPHETKALIAEWKEQILEDCVKLFEATDDPREISNVDRAVALSQLLVNQKAP